MIEEIQQAAEEYSKHAPHKTIAKADFLSGANWVLEKVYREVNRRVNNADKLPKGAPFREFQEGQDDAYSYVMALVTTMINEIQPAQPIDIC